MGQCWSDSKLHSERFEVEKHVSALDFAKISLQFESTVDPMFSTKCQKAEVERHLQHRKKRNISEGLGVADDSKSVNIIQY